MRGLETPMVCSNVTFATDLGQLLFPEPRVLIGAVLQEFLERKNAFEAFLCMEPGPRKNS